MLLAMLLTLIHPASVTTVALDATSATSGPYVYTTYVRGRFDAWGYSGIMRFTITNGFVTGTYRPDTGGSTTTVHGGVDGSRIWFDIATLGGLHINGTRDPSGAIRGMGSSRTGGKQWVFTATLQTPSP
jgi:hypothetical protein